MAIFLIDFKVCVDFKAIDFKAVDFKADGFQSNGFQSSQHSLYIEG